MIAKVFPGKCKGKVTIPPSKSMAHRAIICASLAKGISRIDNVAYSQDILTTIDGMRSLGAEIIKHDDFLEITGIGKITECKQLEIFCNESGSSLRFFIPLFSLCNKRIVFSGKGRLLDRPQSVYEKIFKNQGLSFQHENGTISIEGALQGGEFILDGDVSSQFISGLLFALPLCDKPSTIVIKEPFESRSYVNLTMQMLEHFGIEAEFSDPNTIYIKGNQEYHSGCYCVEGDFSQLAFFACLAALNHDLEVCGVHHNSQQGDKAIMRILKHAQVHFKEIVNGYAVAKSDPCGTIIDLADCPDLGPILCVLAAFSNGSTHIKNAGRLRIKESDRIAAMECELKKLGVRIRSDENDIYIDGSTAYEGGVKFDAHNDHRIVMSLAVAATLCEKPCTIHGAEAVRKSYPQFFDDLIRIGIEVERYE